MNHSSKKWYSISYMNCWKLPLYTFKRASEYINKFGNTFWSLSSGTEALCILVWRMSVFQELFLYTSLFKSPVLSFWSCAPFICKPRTCRQGVLWHHFTGNTILVEEGTERITNLNSHFTEKSVGLLSGHALADHNPFVHCLIAWGFFFSYLYIVNIGELFYRKATFKTNHIIIVLPTVYYI
jgi:hypothetical protein